MADEDSMGSIFANACVAVIISDSLTAVEAEGIQGTIERDGGEAEIIQKSGSLDFDGLTHIISETIDFPQYLDALDYLVSVVKPQWVMQSLTKGKQAQTRPFNPDPKMFFNSMVVACADIPIGDKDAIIGAVLAMGGVESSAVINKQTTHICALTMDHPKCQAASKFSKIKIVLPHWFDDCLKLGRRIDETPYLLPNPRILSEMPEEALPLPPTSHLDGATSAHPDTFNVPTESSSRYRLDVFQDKVVMISEDLKLGSRLRKVIEELIVNGGGSITTSVHEADIYICRWRAGRDYIIAARSNIDVGNLAWLYHLITQNQWTSPLRRLLHYPLPQDGIPGFEKLRITLSNYGGEARIYLENLVHACGGDFTKSMKQDNTHLITARKNSEKCTAAEEWNIDMANHLWLEECYAKCQLLRLTDTRFTHFPPRTNLGEVIGQTHLDRKILEKMYYPRDPTPSPNDPRPTKRKAMSEKDRNFPSSRSDDVHMAGQDEDDSATEIIAPVKKPGRKPKISDNSDRSTPINNRKLALGKENDTPSTGGRSAKSKALKQLHGLADDIALYEKEKKRKGPIWGGERALNKIDKDRNSSPADEESEDEEIKEIPNPKRAKTIAKTAPKVVGKTFAALPPVEIRLLITGYKGWLDNIAKEDKEKKILRDLGILVVHKPEQCTHMAAPAMVRTQKFLCALAHGPTIVSSDFVDTCVQKKAIPDMDEFLLKDRLTETKFGFKLEEALARARANVSRSRYLLHQVPVYCTSEIPNKPETYQAIVKANGGIFNVYRGKGGNTIKPTKPEDDIGPPEPVYLITGPKPVEKKLWATFTEMAQAGNMIPRIVSPEWLLDVAMSQKLDWDDGYLAK